MRKLLLALFVLSGLTYGIAQTTWQQQVFNHQTSSGFSSVVRNINQSAHWVIFCEYTGGNASGTIQIEASADGAVFQTISNVGVIIPNQCSQIQAGGYWNQIKVYVAPSNGASVSAWYSASTGALPVPSSVGLATTDQVVTYVPASPAYVTPVKSAGVQLNFATVPIVVYTVTVYNPNAGTVYAAVGYNPTSLFVSSANPVTGIILQAIPATSSVSFSVPQQGMYFQPTGYGGCSTSATSAVDPGAGCLFTVSYKIANFTIAPN